jgi:phage terminase small subunit
MRPGPKPQSAAEREQKEPVRSKQRKQQAAPEVALPAGGLQPPAWLKKDGLRIWERLAPPLRAAKLLAQTDVDAFARYCRNFARWVKMQKEIDNKGEAYESESQWASSSASTRRS